MPFHPERESYLSSGQFFMVSRFYLLVFLSALFLWFLLVGDAHIHAATCGMAFVHMFPSSGLSGRGLHYDDALTVFRDCKSAWGELVSCFLSRRMHCGMRRAYGFYDGGC